MISIVETEARLEDAGAQIVLGQHYAGLHHEVDPIEKVIFMTGKSAKFSPPTSSKEGQSIKETILK